MATKKKAAKKSPVKKKVAPRGKPVKKASVSILSLSVVENPTKGIAASVDIQMDGDKTSIIAGMLATAQDNSEFHDFMKRLVIGFLQIKLPKEPKRKK